MKFVFIFVIFSWVFSLSYSYNLSEVPMWGTQLGALARSGKSEGKRYKEKSASRSLENQPNYEVPDYYYNFMSKPPINNYYYENSEFEAGERKHYYYKPQKRHDEDIYNVYVPEFVEHTHCKHESRSSEDLLSSFSGFIGKIVKLVLGVFIIMVLPAILAKIFFIPIKLFLGIKMLLKLFLILPILTRLYPGLFSTSSVIAKYSEPSFLEEARNILGAIEADPLESNGNRSSRMLESNVKGEDVVCDQTMLCILDKVAKSKQSTFIPLLSLLLHSRQRTANSYLTKWIDLDKEFQDCMDVNCSMQHNKNATEHKR